MRWKNESRGYRQRHFLPHRSMFIFNKPIILKTKPQFINLSCNFFLYFFLFYSQCISICKTHHTEKLNKKKSNIHTQINNSKTTWTHKFHNSKTISYFTPRPNHYTSDKPSVTWFSQPYHKILILTLSYNENKFLCGIIPLRFSHNKNELT